jgi:hypothetical protein
MDEYLAPERDLMVLLEQLDSVAARSGIPPLSWSHQSRKSFYDQVVVVGYCIDLLS